MASKTEICNLAISHLGVGKEIAALDTESSQEASSCRRFYDIALEATLRDFNWPFTNKYTDLALVEEDPNSEWSFSYRYPTDLLRIKKILSGIRNDTRQSRIPYDIAQDSAGRLVFTDMEDAVIKYSAKTTDTSIFPPDFIIAFSYRLAGFIAPRITAGDPFKQVQRVMQLYEMELSKARATALNEEQDEEAPDSELERDRN